MPKETAKKAVKKVKSWINTSPRRGQPEDIPLGGMSGEAAKNLRDRKSRLDEEIARSGG